MLHSLVYRWLSFTLVVVLVMFGAFGCSKEGKIARHMERADEYFSRQEYKEAAIEYLNVLKLDPNNAAATTKLGVTYFNQGDLKNAFPYLAKAEQLEPENLDVRIKLGKIYLLARKMDETRREAEFVLGKEPNAAKAFGPLDRGMVFPLFGDEPRRLNDSVSFFQKPIKSCKQF